MNRHIAPIGTSPRSPTRADEIPARVPSLLVIRERRGNRYVVTLYYAAPHKDATWISGLSEPVATAALRSLHTRGCFIIAGYNTRRRLGMEVTA